MLEAITIAASRLLDIDVILVICLGVAIGMIFGALPGLSGNVAIGIVLPFTFGWDPILALYFFIGIVGSVTFSGSIPAILLNTPGTPPNAATCFDGHPMALKGQAGKALGISATSSGLGAVFGVVILIVLIPVLRIIVLAFGSPEFFWIVVFGLVTVAYAARANMVKGLLAGAIGILISMIGVSNALFMSRFAGGSWYLEDGLPLVPFAVGLFAISELIRYTVRGGSITSARSIGKISGVMEGVKEVFKHKTTFFRSAAIGSAIGIIPGVGGTAAAFMSYTTAVQTSKHPETFGTGEPEGIIAPEAANDAKDGGALVPTITFGIPGSAVMAMLLGAFILHGIVPGPLLLRDHLDLVWVLVLGLVLSNVLTSTMGLMLAPYLARLVNVRVAYITPVILILCATGAYVIRGNVWDVLLLTLVGFFGYGMVRFGFPTVCLVIGYLLGDLAETSYLLSLQSSYGSYSIFYEHTVSQVIIALLVITLLLPFISILRKRKGAKDQGEAVKTQAVAGFYRKGSFWFTMLLLIIALTFVLGSFDFDARGRAIPLLIGIPAIILAAILLIGEKYPGLIARFNVSMDSIAKVTEGGKAKSKETDVGRKVLSISSWIAGFVVSIFFLGFAITAPLFTFLFLKIHGRADWLKTAILTLAVGLVIYGGFERLMEANLFKGILFGEFVPPV
ncbi:tripartite tricarboxylate transporter permease [Chloroflexota bacterium]